MKFPAKGFNSEPPEGFIYLAALLNFVMEANAEPLDIHYTGMGSSTSRHYVVSYPLGSGRNSLVFAARDMMNQRQVCIKIEPIQDNIQITNELQVLQKLETCVGVPKVLFYGRAHFRNSNWYALVTGEHKHVIFAVC